MSSITQTKIEQLAEEYCDLGLQVLNSRVLYSQGKKLAFDDEELLAQFQAKQIELTDLIKKTNSIIEKTVNNKDEYSRAPDEDVKKFIEIQVKLADITTKIARFYQLFVYNMNNSRDTKVIINPFKQQ